MNKKLDPWQPMETAPRDGTVIDLFHANGFRLTDTWWDDDCWVGIGVGDEEFLGWMPVPPYPKGEK